MNIPVSCFGGDFFTVPVLETGWFVSIPWGEGETCADLEDRLTFEYSLEDILTPDFFPEDEEVYERERAPFWPWEMRVYGFRDYYIISSEDLWTACPSVMPSCVAIPKNKFGLVRFVKEFCLPFIKRS